MSGLDNSRFRAKTRLDLEKTEVRNTFYRPLEQQFDQIQNIEVDTYLRDLGRNPDLRTVMPQSLRQMVRAADKSNAPSAPLIPASLQSLQDLRNELRSRAFNSQGDIADREALARADELTELLHDVVGDELREADQAWARISGNERALERGWSMFNAEADLIDEARAAMTTEQLAHFDEGRLARITSRLTSRNKGASGLLRRYMDMGPESRRQVASLFPGGAEGQSFARLEHMLKSEATNAAIADFFNSAIKSAAIGVAGGVVAGGIMSRGER